MMSSSESNGKKRQKTSISSSSINVTINKKINVKFPFEPYECQRIFMKNVIDVLDRKLDAALESPTGTGKTLSLLCSVLAWVQKEKETRPMDFATWQTSGAGGAKSQTEDNLKSSFIPKIYYASRTHSQLEQVVHELNRTEYKWVKTTILGSREHFCINQKVKKIKESNRQAHICRGLVSKRSCHYYNKYDSCSTEKVSEFLETGEAMDIEDFVKIGTQNSICPYYLSRQRSETAELILLPYNYIIDPKMRRRYKLDLKNSIVIFDEAHNLESICESNASAELTSTSIALCIEELKKVLALLVDEEETARAEADMAEGFGSQKVDLTKKLIENLRTEDLMAVLEKVFSLEEHFDSLFQSEQLKTVPPLDGKASDGEVLLETLAKAGLDGSSVERMVDILRDATSYLLSKNEEVSLTEKGDGMERLADFLLSIFSTHAQEVAAAVGDENVQLVDRVDIKSIARNCKLYMRKESGSGRLTIKYFCFQASISMRMLKMRGVRNVLLASGTLSPIQAFTYNMGLNFGAILENEHALKQVPVLTSVVTRGKMGGLIGSYQNRKNPGYLADVAETLIKVMEATPQGILIFFSSYSQMDEMVETWKSTKRSQEETFWQKMEKSKRVVVEPRAKEELASVRLRYTQGVSDAHGAALLAVCRGKVSEGIDFCDAESRAVIIVGIPYPPIHDERVVLKRAYLDDLMGRKEEERKERQSSQDWYQMEAFRAVNQAIGRVLRHKDDFGTVVLVDARYASAKLEMFPKWLRGTIGKGDSDLCAMKTQRFFKERGALIENSKSDYVKKQEKKCKTFKQPRQSKLFDSREALQEATLEDIFSPANLRIVQEEAAQRAQPPPKRLSFLGLPTNEDELKIKEWEQGNEFKPTIPNPFSVVKRKFKEELEDVTSSASTSEVQKKEPPKKKKIFVLTRQTLPSRYQKALESPTSDLIKNMSDDDKKQFTATLKAYKTSQIQWAEVFQRLRNIYLPQKPELFISAANILRSEDQMRYLKKAIENKI